MSLEKEATAETRKPHKEDEADVEILDSAKTQDPTASPLNQHGALVGEHTAVSQRMGTETAQDTRHRGGEVLDLRKDSQIGELLVGNSTTELTNRLDVDDTRRFAATPQNQTSPSEDVSLDLGGGLQEDDMGMRNRRHDDSGIEERRVAFLPPPRM